MDAAARLRGRHALDAVDAALVFELAVDAAPLDHRDHFLQPADAGIAARHHFDAPPLPFGVHRVHAEQLGREQRRLVAAGAGADLEHDVLVVVRILGNEQDLELGEQRVAAHDQRLELFSRQFAHVRVAPGRQFLGLRDVLRDGLVLAELLHQRLDFGERLGVLPVLRRLGLYFARPEQPHQVFVALFFRSQLIEHKKSCWLLGAGC